MYYIYIYIIIYHRSAAPPEPQHASTVVASIPLSPATVASSGPTCC